MVDQALKIFLAQEILEEKSTYREVKSTQVCCYACENTDVFYRLNFTTLLNFLDSTQVHTFNVILFEDTIVFLCELTSRGRFHKGT